MDQDNTKLTNTELVVDEIIDMLAAKNPLFETQRDAYRAKLIPQYETYLMTNLMGMLSETQYAEFEKLLNGFPMDKKKHNEYLKSTITDFSDILVDLAQNYIRTYSEMIGQMQ